MLFLHTEGLSDGEKQNQFTQLEQEMTSGPITADHAARMLSLVRELPPETATDILSDIFMMGVETAQTHLEEDPLPEVPDTVVSFFRLALGFCLEGSRAAVQRESISPSA